MTNALRRAMARRWVKKRTKLLKNEILNESKIDGLKDPEEVHQLYIEHWKVYFILFDMIFWIRLQTLWSTADRIIEEIRYICAWTIANSKKSKLYCFWIWVMDELTSYQVQFSRKFNGFFCLTWILIIRSSQRHFRQIKRWRMVHRWSEIENFRKIPKNPSHLQRIYEAG